MTGARTIDGGTLHRFVVAPEEAGLRLDLFLAKKEPGLSRSQIQRAVAAHIEARRSDPEFRQRLKASMERNREILERLAR